jgi:1,4-dihydroxy-2-naphthoyl-CoA hydrolase
MPFPDLATAQKVWAQLTQHTAEGHLGVTLISVDEGGLVLELPITDRTRQPYGRLHGGISALLAEGAASTHAAMLCDLPQVHPVGLELNASHLASAFDGHIQARARLLRRGHSTAVHEVHLVHVESGRLLCVARVTNLYRKTGGT